jgi:sigma-B regulation protein RsbU (phosphoserine phosphatase)
MAALIILEGPDAGRNFSLKAPVTKIGRDPAAEISLTSTRVSRNHAQIHCVGTDVYVEDAGSRNGTFINGEQIRTRTLLQAKDRLTVGEFVLGLQAADSISGAADRAFVIHETLDANRGNADLFTRDAAHKLQMVLELTQNLNAELDLQGVLDNLLENLLRLFPRADRGIVLLSENGNLVVRAQRGRRPGMTDFSFSRTIVNKSLNEGVGILSEDTRADSRFDLSQSLRTSNTHSLLCVPLISKGDRRLGVIQLDRTASGAPFRPDDLSLLTTLALQVAVVVDHAALQADLVRQELLRKELAVARDIQQGFLPTNFAVPLGSGYEIFASVTPAREVSGDLYDFFALPDGRLALFVGDVSGKGMPAALFMIAVRTLARHLAPSGSSPAETLIRLNAALAADNPASMFVTLAYAIYDPKTGNMTLASGGHPPPLLVGADGAISEVPLPPGQLLGYSIGTPRLSDATLHLMPGETLVFYSDGFTEAFAPDGEAMFDVAGIEKSLRGGQKLPLRECATRLQSSVQAFAGSHELQDDQTLLLIRRVG